MLFFDIVLRKRKQNAAHLMFAFPCGKANMPEFCQCICSPFRVSKRQCIYGNIFTINLYEKQQFIIFEQILRNNILIFGLILFLKAKSNVFYGFMVLLK